MKTTKKRKALINTSKILLCFILIFAAVLPTMPFCSIARTTTDIDMTEETVERSIETGSTPSNIPYTDIGKKIDAYVNTNQGEMASVSINVFLGQEDIFTGYYGYSDMENKVLTDENTVYEWGSITKLLTWVSVMQLYEKGLLDLDADIRNYLPEGFLRKLKYDDPITMLNLMNHNAGWQETLYGLESKTEEGILPLGDALIHSEPQQVHRPGEVTAYSNWGAALAGYIVENVSGMNFADYVKENIFKPLGMEHTAIKPDYTDNPWVKEQRNKLCCYSVTPDNTVNLGNSISYIQLYPAGSATGTLNDLSLFAKSFTVKNDEECLLFESVNTLKIMKSPSSYYGNDELPRVLHGMWVMHHKVETCGHNGNTGGFSTNFMFDPKTGLGVVIMTNEPGESTFCGGIPGMLYGSYKNNERAVNAGITKKLQLTGFLFTHRTCEKGPLSMLSCLSFIPVGKSKDSVTYPVMDGISFTRLNDREFLMVQDKISVFFYIIRKADGSYKIESEGTDYRHGSTFSSCISLASVFYPLILVVVLIIAAIVTFILFIIRKIRKKEKNKTDKLCRALYAAQYILAIIYGIFFFITYFLGLIPLTKKSIILICMVVLLFGVAFASMGIINIYHCNKLMKKRDIKKKGYIKYYVLSIAELMTVFVMCYWQMFFFWNL